MDVMPVTVVQELFAYELGAIVGDDDVGYSELVDNVGEEKDGLLGADVVMGRASIHLENLLMATSKCVYPHMAFYKGPTRSRPHTANGHVMGIIWGE